MTRFRASRRGRSSVSGRETPQTVAGKASAPRPGNRTSLTVRGAGRGRGPSRWGVGNTPHPTAARGGAIGTAHEGNKAMTATLTTPTRSVKPDMAEAATARASRPSETQRM